MKAKYVIVIFLLCFWQISTLSAAEVVKVGIGLAKPPYIIQEKNAGAEYDIVKRALEIAGYRMVPQYMPLIRITHNINGGKIDAGMTMRPHMAVDGFFSDVVMVYHNYGISLKERNVVLNSFDDLKDISLVAFQNAHKLLGESFSKAVKDNKKYSEISRQALQVRMLAGGRVEAVIADFRIFLHFKKQFEKEYGAKLAVRFHPLFEPTPYRLAFKDRDVRDKFDKALAEMRESGEYDRILEQYITKEDLKALTDMEN